MIPQTKVLITKFPFRSRIGGVEKHTFQIVENLQNQGIDFFLLSSCSVMLSEFRKRGWRAERWWLGLAPVSAGTKLLFLFSLPFLIISAIIALVYYKIAHKVEKLYCLTITEKLIFTPIASLLGYEIIWLEHLSIDPVIAKNIYKVFYKWWSGLVVIVAISQFVRQELENIGIKNVKVIYHGVDPEKYKKQEDLFGAMAERKTIDYDKNNFTIGCVARLEKVKGLEYLVKAVDLIKAEIPEIDCVIVGEGSQRDNLHWLIETLNLQNKIKLVGYKDNFPDWIYNFDVFVLPSLKESLGVLAIEAMACGRPVIATKSGGTVEIIDNEKHGMLVEPGNPRALAEAILWLHKNPDLAVKYAEAAREKVAEKFLLSEMLIEYRKLLIY